MEKSPFVTSDKWAFFTLKSYVDFTITFKVLNYSPKV